MNILLRSDGKLIDKKTSLVAMRRIVVSVEVVVVVMVARRCHYTIMVGVAQRLELVGPGEGHKVESMMGPTSSLLGAIWMNATNIDVILEGYFL